MEKKRGIDSFTLHILAMLFMLCDHLWATLFPAQEWMTCVGRLAFPIFAFMIAEGCYYTSNVKKYMLRLFLFAIILKSLKTSSVVMLAQVANVFNNVISENVTGLSIRFPLYARIFFFYFDVDNTAVL